MVFLFTGKKPISYDTFAIFFFNKSVLFLEEVDVYLLRHMDVVSENFQTQSICFQTFTGNFCTSTNKMQRNQCAYLGNLLLL